MTSWTAARAAQVTVAYNDARVNYVGGGWNDDIFEIRPEFDPPAPGSGANGTVCRLQQKSTTTRNIGDSFSFSFTGAALPFPSLLMR